MYSADQSSLVSAYGSFFGSWPWDHYATLTFARKLSDSTCLRHWDDFINTLGRLTMVVWSGSEQMNGDGLVMPARRFPFTAMPCSNTRTCLLLRLWLVCGRQELGMRRLRRTIVVVAQPITLRRCSRTVR